MINSLQARVHIYYDYDYKKWFVATRWNSGRLGEDSTSKVTVTEAQAEELKRILMGGYINAE